MKCVDGGILIINRITFGVGREDNGAVNEDNEWIIVFLETIGCELNSIVNSSLFIYLYEKNISDEDIGMKLNISDIIPLIIINLWTSPSYLILN